MKEDVKEYISQGDTPSVYVSTYAKYNGGTIYGAWIDLTTVSDSEDFIEVCKLLHNDEEDPEFMFQDYEGFPSTFYGESSLDVDKILTWYNLDEQDQDVLAAGLEYYSKTLSDIDDLEEFLQDVRYHIIYYSTEEFELACDDIINESVSDSMRCYIDYDKVYREFAWDYSIYNDIYFQ